MVKNPEMLFAPAAASVPDAVIDRVSVPVPPVKLSPAFNELDAAVAVSLRIVELKVSLPAPPVNSVPVSRPVVSDLSHALDKSLILNSLLRILDDLFLITYDAPTVTKIIAKLKVPKAEVLSGLS